MRNAWSLAAVAALTIAAASQARAQFCPGVSPWVFDDVAASETLPAPGPRCIHTCLMPSSAHSRIVSSAISGLVPITTAWMLPGIELKSG